MGLMRQFKKMKLKSYKDDLLKELKDPEYAAAWHLAPSPLSPRIKPRFYWLSGTLWKRVVASL